MNALVRGLKRVATVEVPNFVFGFLVGAMISGFAVGLVLYTRYGPRRFGEATVYRVWGARSEIYYAEDRNSDGGVRSHWTFAPQRAADWPQDFTDAHSFWYRSEDINGDGKPDLRAYGLDLRDYYWESDDDGDGVVDRRKFALSGKAPHACVLYTDTDFDGHADEVEDGHRP